MPHGNSSQLYESHFKTWTFNVSGIAHLQKYKEKKMSAWNVNAHYKSPTKCEAKRVLSQLALLA